MDQQIQHNSSSSPEHVCQPNQLGCYDLATNLPYDRRCPSFGYLYTDIGRTENNDTNSISNSLSEDDPFNISSLF